MKRHFIPSATTAASAPIAPSLAALVLLLCSPLGTVDRSLAGTRDRVDVPEIVASRPLLRYERPGYRNYTFNNYSNPPDHSFPYRDRQNAIYNSFGDYLLTGYPLYDWTERRTPNQIFGSSISKDLGTFENVIDNLVVARDGYGDWGISAMMGDAMIARLSPLTLSRTDFNGARLDFAHPFLRISLLGSRIEKPTDARSSDGSNFYNDSTTFREGRIFTFFADGSVLLLGSRLEADLGMLRLGLNGTNIHLYQSTRSGGSTLKGVVHPKQPLLDWVVVRFSDDSPEDGRGGPVVHEVLLIINGEPRPDITPGLVRRRAGLDTQVGTISQRTGVFRPIIYDNPRAARGGGSRASGIFYRGRNDLPLYADYMYRLNHEAGIDVSDITNLKGLLANFEVLSPDAIHQADGDEQLVYLFDLSGEPIVRSVEVQAMVANDYRIDVATLSEPDPGAPNLTRQFKSTFYRTAKRAKENVRDLSNLGQVRFRVGEQTGLFTYSSDFNLQFAGAEFSGEFARSALYSRFPARQDREAIYSKAPAFSERGSAYYINGTRWLGRWQFGGELFAMNPDYQTTLRTYQEDTFVCCYAGKWGGMVNETLYWDLIQDNEDGDAYPDRRPGELLALPIDDFGDDRNGVLIGLDEDQDGVPDTDRNFNQVPDYDEPFLLYSVEANEYVYGLDRNNNDEPDVREDDLDWDYPYDLDQGGYHFFGRYKLTDHWSATFGQHDVNQIAGAGQNRSTYGIVDYRRQNLSGRQKVFIENHFRRVRDDVPDEYTDHNERSTSGQRVVRVDQLLYRDSYVNESYLEAWISPWRSVSLVQKLRWRINWQQRFLRPGTAQRERRLDFTSIVSRAEYRHSVGDLDLTAQFKYLRLRLRDRNADRSLRFEESVIPILKGEFPLLSRTSLRFGVEGWGPFPYSFEEQGRASDSFERRTAFITMTNRTAYFGYDLYTIFGFSKDKQKFDSRLQRDRSIDTWGFFIRGLIGFTEYGDLI